MSLKLKIITSSTRPGRIGPIISSWVAEQATAHGKFEVEILDLDTFGLPLLDEPNHPAMQSYTHEHTKAWSAAVNDADAFIFVTPEYNSFPPAAVVNALQALVLEWERKPAGVVSYGGISGGLRSAQELRMLLANMNIMPLKQVVPMPMVFGDIKEDGKLSPNSEVGKGTAGMLDELAIWAAALKPTRA
ncbi:NADPH-dependent FMN reductase [Salipiger marinus]|jgi:NAD(P)H-dependent FMN reductase|uniref:NAD(P)H-dependent FMN reductase n=1 Tax=Salipiger marinus TaxID=555512 RepID=A0A1G8TMG2_9RHOB|nr:MULTISPECIES: NADPH-dependent FMN reductase [Salipiger]MCD1620586.1 NAD(P)H-dependent oxidoreductase [Salipiger manganoxidans]MEB3421378.1 NADPH-dependent FMN reductase [Salipiger manganoxidans]SDJ41870.1 NAD(P)H-dependent FMN reductase [Salipiger marinus]HBM58341.1 NAD(P)H-dependent oxidoreductase [Citreicella sp.]